MNHQLTIDLVVESRLVLPGDRGQVDRNVGERDERTDAGLHRLLEHRQQHEEGADHEEEDQQTDVHFDRSLQVRLFVAQPEEAGHAEGDEQALVKRGVVDE